MTQPTVDQAYLAKRQLRKGTAGWMLLDEDHVEKLRGKEVQVCIWLEQEYADYEIEFALDYQKTPS